MKKIFSLSAIALVLVLQLGCKRSDDPTKGIAPQVPSDKITFEAGAQGMRTTIKYSSQEVDSILALPQASRPSDPIAAVADILSDPPKLALAPHLMPAKQVQIVAKTDSTVLLSAIGGKVPNALDIFLKKLKHGKDSAWVVMRLEEGGPTGPPAH